ncbi:hypothetical protein Poly24_27290 [Rosistilla carotiformis]|uniref:DNA primase TraC n=1 Tax=Rosistilla carotiformis TaxID=2528017 RepID=A0A518JU04_9BACT|nr:hypothetical protein [Rosistilla carotiformis]QDV69015.1 hypothetical protein Poly24_27290 [Rosistilla carotiformis]
MIMKNKAEEAAKQILSAFESPESLPGPIARVIVNRRDGSPCRKWSWRNQLIVAINGYSEARGFRQWDKVERRVKKGEKSIRILSPLSKSIKDKNDEDRIMVYGFRGTPVFGIEQTEGKPITGCDREVLAWLNDLPLREVADAWGLSVEAYNGSGANYAGVYRHDQSIALGVKDLSTWCHELVHAADHRNGKLQGSSKPSQEIVAQLGSSVILTILGFKHDADLGRCWSYIQQFAGESTDKALKKCGEVLDRTCDAVALILDEAERLSLEPAANSERGETNETI